MRQKYSCRTISLMRRVAELIVRSLGQQGEMFVTLTSGIYKRYKKLFILDDDGLRRIEGVLRKAAAEYSEPLHVVFHVRREDDRFYETENVDEVLSDPNITDKRIKLLGIEVRKVRVPEQDGQEHDRIAWVVFDKDDPPMQTPEVVLRISSPDKTWALMLADALEPQITRLFKVKRFPNWLFLLFAPIGGLIAYRISKSYPSSSDEAMSIARLTSVACLALVLTLMVHTRIAEKKFRILRIFSSEPVFHWGEEVASSGDRDALRKNILWVVVIGFIVSLLAGLVPLLI